LSFCETRHRRTTGFAQPAKTGVNALMNSIHPTGAPAAAHGEIRRLSLGAAIGYSARNYNTYHGRTIVRSSIIFAAMGALLLPGVAGAVEIKVISTQAPEEAYRELVPQFEKASGHKVTTVFTGTLDLQKRIGAGETYDLIIMAGPAIDDFIKSGKVVPGSRVNIAKSGVGVGVRAGAPKPDISSTEAVKKTLLAAKSIGYSTGPSGVYLTGLFQRLGVAEQIKPKLKQTPTGIFVGTLVASGEAEIGFQQVSELSHFAGVDYVGPLPADIQEITVFSSGIQVGAKQVDAANAWVKFLTAPAAAPAFKSKGLEPG
jgi:molybdate transport system substrate-binding protein